MGDAPKDVEDRLVKEDGTVLASDILKVGHHGSRTSTGDTFAALVHPAYALISVGAHNTYGLPDEEPISTLEKDGSKVLRTDQVGTIIFQSDGEKFSLVKPYSLTK
jgi:competence protein ComEC